MAALNAWQKIDRVIPGKPWGDGADGSATISSDPNTRATYTGTATESTGTAGSSAFANGDLVKIIQSQGTGVGQWEINMVASGGGSTSLTMQQPNYYTYTTGAQIIKIPRYTTATITAHSVTAWNGTIGADEIFCARTSVGSSGALSGNGLGFRGATTKGDGGTAYYGEGQTNLWNTQGYSSGTNSGGGGYYFNSNNCQGGGGGGNGTAGAVRPGAATGNTDLTSMIPAGAGGSGTRSANTAGTGGNAGANITIFSKTITPGAAITALGNAGQDASPTDSGACGAGGGGAGGNVLLVCETASIGTYITATGGNRGLSGTGESVYAGAGGTGCIAIHHSGTVTGTTNPTFTDVTDATLKETVGGAFLYNFV